MKSVYARRCNSGSSNTTLRERPFFKKESSPAAFFKTPASAAFFPSSVLQRKCEHCHEEDSKKEQQVHRSEVGAAAPGTLAAAPVSTGPAQALPACVNRFFSSALVQDFSGVAIHTGAEANQAAKRLHAKAYTLGNHIVFAEGQYQPETAAGKRLLAHELTHVVQQQGQRLSRQEAEETEADATQPELEETLGTVNTTGAGSTVPPKVAFGNCAGAHVSGRTDANYDQGNYSVSGARVNRARGCAACAPAQCVTVSGTITSIFQANPSVTLPSVPAGNWNDCERAAIQNFIDTTLSQHEQQHVAAFNSYNGTVNTPFSYTGCQDGWEAHVANIHEGLNRSRAAAANRLSDALDANGANNFTITCNCPNPAPDTP